MTIKQTDFDLSPQHHSEINCPLSGQMCNFGYWIYGKCALWIERSERNGLGYCAIKLKTLLQLPQGDDPQ